MDMASHFEIDGDGACVGLKRLRPLSLDEIRSCPDCRGPLRDLARYGRIVRRAQIDSATLKFIVRANTSYVALAQEFYSEQKRLVDTKDGFRVTHPSFLKSLVLKGGASRSSLLSPTILVTSGTRRSQQSGIRYQSSLLMSTWRSSHTRKYTTW